MSLANATNNNLFAIISPIINFKSIGVNAYFTTPLNVKFAPAFTQFICETATAANGDSIFQVGWTPSTYNDYITDSSFGPTTANMSLIDETGSTAVPIFPANTVIKINVTQADSGAAITGRIAIYGVYI